MDRETQAQLVNYVKEGGHLFIWPGLPDRDLNFNPCSLMKESFGLTEGTPRKMIPEEAKIALFELKDISVLSPIRVFEPERTIPGKTEKFAYTTDGACCGLTRRIGRGQVTLLGTCFGYNIAEHLTALEKLAASAPESSLVKLTNPELQYHLRLGKDYAFLFILNYTPVHQQTQVNLESLAAKMGINLPAVKTVSLPPVRGLMIPVHFPLGLHDTYLLWTTGEVLAINRKADCVEILVQPVKPNECELLFTSSSPPQVTVGWASGRPSSHGPLLCINPPGRPGAIDRPRLAIIRPPRKFETDKKTTANKAGWQAWHVKQRSQKGNRCYCFKVSLYSLICLEKIILSLLTHIYPSWKRCDTPFY